MNELKDAQHELDACYARAQVTYERTKCADVECEMVRMFQRQISEIRCGDNAFKVLRPKASTDSGTRSTLE